jgi:chemotaxis protein methyltransferase CheR
VNATVAINARGRGAAAELDRTTFERVVKLAAAEAGLMITPTKTALVQSRLMRRLRALKMTSFGDYLDLVESDGGRDEVRQMISVLTTNVSHFYREQHHFDMLRAKILPDLVARAVNGGSVRIWSAGCSSGQEPYSIAMEILRLDPQAGDRDIRILATDIDPAILDVAREAIYRDETIQGVPDADRKEFFEETGDGLFKVRRKLRHLVTFRELNLIAPWPMKRQFDVIFCRNVVIYFNEDTQRRLWPRFESALAPGGTIFVGHSERIHDMPGLNLKNVGVTAYRRHGATVHRLGDLSERE